MDRLISSEGIVCYLCGDEIISRGKFGLLECEHSFCLAWYIEKSNIFVLVCVISDGILFEVFVPTDQTASLHMCLSPRRSVALLVANPPPSLLRVRFG